jgi:MFS family permease
MTSETRRSITRTAWLVVALLWPVALLNYLDRQMLAAMKFSVMTDVPSIGSEARWGLLPAVFKWVYAALSPVGGYLADRFSRRYVIGVSLLVWSAVTWATGHVTTFDQLVVTRSLMGISEACYFPAALALIADFHVGPTRSRAVGLHQMAIYVGVIVGGFSGHVADAPNLGWRWGFSAAGLAGMLYALPLLFFLPETSLRTSGSSKDKPSPGMALGQLVRNGSFLLLVAYFALPSLPGWVVRDWMPAILKQRFNIGQGVAGVSATLYLNIAALCAALIGGWLADRWMRRSERGRILVSALGMSLLIPALFGVGNAGTLGVAIFFLTLFGFGWGFFDCNNMPILCQIVRPELRATGYGIMNLVGISCGGFADWSFGALRDRQVPDAVVFGIFASFAIISIVLVFLIRPRPTEAPPPSASA